MKRLLSFAVAGGGGFLIDAGVLLALLAWTPAGPFLARAVAIVAAIAFTWAFNRRFTFGKSHRPLLAEGARYGSVGLVSAVLNYGLYISLLIAVPGLQPLAALVFASLAAMGFSFLGYSRFVFCRR